MWRGRIIYKCRKCSHVIDIAGYYWKSSRLETISSFSSLYGMSRLAIYAARSSSSLATSISFEIGTCGTSESFAKIDVTKRSMDLLSRMTRMRSAGEWLEDQQSFFLHKKKSFRVSWRR